MKSIALAFVFIVSLLALPPPANADRATAKQHFDQASAAYKAGRYREAATLFSRAYEEDRHPETLFNVARSHEKAGNDSKALEAYRRYLVAQPNSSDRATVESRIKELEQRVEKPALGQVKIFSTPSGATVVLDGAGVGKTPWSGELKPGKHVIVLKRAGFLRTTREISLTPDRPVELDVTLEEPSLTPASRTALTADSVAPSTAPPPSYAEPYADFEREPAVRPLTWVAFGVGAVAIGGAIGFELARQSAEEDADAALTQIEHRDHYETMENRQTASRILAGVGAAAVVTGGVLLIVDLNRDRRPVRVGVGCQLSACGIAARGNLP